MTNKTQPMPQRILIVRLSALGDVVMASGLISALHARFPQAQISWLCEAPCRPLLQHNPRLHQVLIWPRAEWRQLRREKRWAALWSAFRQFRAQLRAEQFDLVLDAQGLLKSGVCAWLTQAPRRLSIIAREGSHLLCHERLIPPPNNSGIISSEYRYLAHYLGANDSDFQFDLAVGIEPLQTAQALLKQERLNGPFVALCPFTTRPQKHWFDERWAALAAALQQQGLQPVLFGGPGDVVAAQRITGLNPSIVNLCGRMPLDVTVAALSQASLVIGVDTGLTHMGTALSKPTVALFGATRPYLQTGSDLTRVLYNAPACSPCRRSPTCQGRYDCMQAHHVAQVLTAAQTVLQARERP